MKKALLFTTIFCMLSTYGQESEESSEQVKKTQFGIKAGLNLATIRGDVSNASNRVGGHFGVTAEFRISDMFSIQPEILYSMQGVKESVAEDLLGNGILIRGEGTTKMDYLNLPVLAKIYLSNGLALEAGPQIGILVSGKVSYDLNYEGENVSGTQDVTSDLNTIDFGLSAGLSYQLQSSGVFFQGRYNLGLTNTYKGTDNVEGKNGVLQFSIGYKLP